MTIRHAWMVRFVVLLCAPAAVGATGAGHVLESSRIGPTDGDVSSDAVGWFGHGVTVIGDLDADGVDDLAVGVPQYLDPDLERVTGAVWILRMADHDVVAGESHVASGYAGFDAVLDDGDHFGHAVAGTGDLNDDGIPDLAVGAPYDDDGGEDRGAVWILFLTADGSVSGHQKISHTAGGFGGVLHDDDRFGESVTHLGDLDGDGVEDIAVGHSRADDAGTNTGAVWILFLEPGGTVKDEQKISGTEGGFGGVLSVNDYFGSSVTLLGDLDGDSHVELAVGAPGDNDGDGSPGAVWVLSLLPDGTVLHESKISALSGGFSGAPSDADRFGIACARVPDLDGDGVPELAVGANGDDAGALNAGAVWLLFLRPDGTVDDHVAIRSGSGGLGTVLAEGDAFGTAVVAIDDATGDGVPDLYVGARGDTGGRGAVWSLALADATVAVPPAGDGPRRLASHPEPATSVVTLRVPDGATVLTIHDVTGRRVASLERSGRDTITWDLTDAGGRRVTPGVYLVSVPGNATRQRITVR